MPGLLLRLLSQGQGGLTPVLIGVCCMAMDAFFPKGNLSIAAGIFISGPVCWVVGTLLSKHSKTTATNENGETVSVPQTKHSFLWIPMQWWPLPLCVVALWVLITNPFSR